MHLNPLVCIVLWMDLLPKHDFVTSCIGCLEESSSVSYADFSNVDVFRYTVFGKLLSSRWQIPTHLWLVKCGRVIEIALETSLWVIGKWMSFSWRSFMLMALKMSVLLSLFLFLGIAWVWLTHLEYRTGNSCPFQIDLLTWRNFCDGMCRCTSEHCCCRCLVSCQRSGSL